VRDWTGAARRWTIVFLAAGVAWRLIRYGLAFPVWSDEAAVLLSLVRGAGYADLLRPPDHGQVAPLGFLAAQLTALRVGGASEYALRAVPLVTGLAALGAFARLAWLALPPPAATFAVGVLAATHYVTRYALEIKPYGTDLLAAAGLLALALPWLRAPERRRGPLALMLVTPVALLASYPAVFVAGAIGVALAAALLRRRVEPAAWVPLALYAAIVLVSLAGLLYASAGAQLVATRADMLRYWARGFPPGEPVRLVVWLLDVHTAEMMSYPLGGKNGASTLTLLVGLVGIHRLRTRGQTDLLVLLGSLFGLTLLAAALGVYPYGGSARVAQHLAPAICLLVGSGLEAIVLALAPARQRIAATVVCTGLLLVALGGLTRDVLHPYQTPAHQELRRLLTVWARERRSDSGVWLMDPLESFHLSVQWYLLRAVDGDRARLDGGAAGAAALTRYPEWWLVTGDPRDGGDQARPPRPELRAVGYVVGRTSRVTVSQPRPGIPDDVVQLQQWRRPP
jgi:hypothetical protein